MTGFDIWRISTATKMHFTTSYDAFKFNFKAKNLNHHSYTNAKGKYYYEKHAKKFKNDTIIKRYAFSNIFFKDILWFGEMQDDAFNEYSSHLQSLSYLFQKDLRKLSNHKFDDVLNGRGKIPLIINEYLCGNVLAETVIILNTMTNFIDIVQVDENDILWPEIKNKLLKATPFVKNDVGTDKNIKSYRNIVLKTFS
jgi:hypothetical protein